MVGGGGDTMLWYSKTPVIRVPGDQFNRFELKGFRIRGDYILLFQTIKK